MNRKNYRSSDNINYLDGDYQSLTDVDWKNIPDTNTTDLMYQYGVTSLITDRARVFKGGSWKDAAYYMSPSARRFLDENESSSAIGFRCAMIRVGGTYPGQ